MFGKIFVGILAVIFWPITLGVGAIILIWAVWMAFFTTKDHYRAPRDEETGEEIKSFLMGGEWDDDYPPNDEHCINAWMFLLSDAEDIAKDDEERKNVVLTRAVRILNYAGVNESDTEFNAAKHSIVPDLLYHLKLAKHADWLEPKLIEKEESLLFTFSECLDAANNSKGINAFTSDWKKLADEELKRVKGTIPDYSEEEISSLAKQFATFIRANEQDLSLTFDNYETISFSKALCRFEWGGETVTETGLAHVAATFTYSQDRIPSGSVLEQDIWDEVSQKKSDYDYEYGFLFSSTTSKHNGKNVPVCVDIDEAPEHYIWTVSEGSMDYDVYEEKKEGDVTEECIRIECSVGELTAVFDIVNDSSCDKFLDQLKNHLDQLNETVPKFLKDHDES